MWSQRVRTVYRGDKFERSILESVDFTVSKQTTIGAKAFVPQRNSSVVNRCCPYTKKAKKKGVNFLENVDSKSIGSSGQSKYFFYKDVPQTLCAWVLHKRTSKKCEKQKMS